MRQNVRARRLALRTAAMKIAAITWGTELSRKMLKVLRRPMKKRSLVRTKA